MQYSTELQVLVYIINDLLTKQCSVKILGLEVRLIMRVQNITL